MFTSCLPSPHCPWPFSSLHAFPFDLVLGVLLSIWWEGQGNIASLVGSLQQCMGICDTLQCLYQGLLKTP